ncbi:TIGR03752 family integrating conjugative element protein [Ottowia sp.]|uniref:TIGR03752 family integrating conjugative element protein n=1 Tax=Ottowia sp. TaxID=1898956 RepID=UPI0025D8593C|nr:TIGR03752 family integrating conjugative element protein [Ottowia sp.]MBK6616020.1 TIGR03752 family integrating conjugative element protein [Ottowia sp.]
MKALGIAGDTPRDTVATLVAQVKQLRNELQSALGDNKQHKAENERMRARESAIDQRIQSALEGERSRLEQERNQVASDRQQTQGLLQDLQRQLDGLAGKGGPSDLPVGLGLEEGDGKRFNRGVGGTQWVEPDDAKVDAKNGSKEPSFPLSFGPAQKSLSAAVESVADVGSRAVGASTKAVYTVPSNSTLMGSVAMTALIGRVPIDGTVNDPYPFKVLIGPDNLTANGIDIPDVAGAVVSGTASGDWTLSACAGKSARSRSCSRTAPSARCREDSSKGGSSGGNSGHNDASIHGGLGWISDPYGIPCVSGERRSNAQQYLGSQALITAAGAGAASLIKSDNGSVAVVANSNGSLGTVGISGNEAMGRILAGGVRDMADWVNKLYGQAFAAVYVQPGAKVAVHLEQPLDIDYDAKGRRVHHRTGEAHASDLD